VISGIPFTIPSLEWCGVLESEIDERLDREREAVEHVMEEDAEKEAPGETG
jgi:hypothetical protein